MAGQTIILHSPLARSTAKALIDRAPPDAVITIKPAKRTTDQNAKMWAMISDISRAKPGGRCHTTETWKCLFMQACGYEVQFLMGLDGNPFPSGFRSSRMSKQQMCDLIDFIQCYGDENGVEWTDAKAIKARADGVAA